MDVERLETWESFVARFSRVSDIFLSKYIRLKVLNEDPAFRGSFRDFLDMSEKIGLVTSASEWMQVRELRNKTAHEYTRDDLKVVFEQVLKMTPFLLSEMKNQKSIGDRRIDLKIISSEDLKTNPFIKSISQSWVRI